jgi:DNA polymerase-4
MPLRYLFLDMNSYFASIEQQYQPELRGKPVAVAPVHAETTACIAASYEAKTFGVKTGTIIRDARRMCPGLIVVPARPKLYIEVHHRIIDAVESCLPVQKVMSIDEMICRLRGDDQRPDRAVLLARQVKQALRTKVGEYLKGSIGLGPNGMLAKVAADMQKPDGLTTIDSGELPQRLFSLKLTDFPGIGPRMEKRFWRHGVGTVEQLCSLTPVQMATVFGSKLMGRLWHDKLRGDDVSERPTKRSSLSQSRVLSPDRRHRAGAEAILIRLLHKAATRLRKIDYFAGHLSLSVRCLDAPRWQADMPLDPCQDTPTLIRAMGSLWRKWTGGGTPYKIGLVLDHLKPAKGIAPSLFGNSRKLERLSRTMDELHSEFGIQSIYFAGMHGAIHEAPVRIAFNHVPDLSIR